MKTWRDLSAAAFVAWGAVYLAWRASSTLSGAPPWLAYPALAIEVGGFVATVLLLGGVRPSTRSDRSTVTDPADPGDSAGSADVRRSADVVVSIDAEPISRLLATLAGVRRTRGVASTTIVSFQQRADVERVAQEYGVHMVVVRPGDSTGWNTALRQGASPFVAILDAGDVPLPDFVETSLADATTTDRVGAVQAFLASWSDDSAESDARGRHQLRFEREMLNPAAGASGAALLSGSGVVLRRDAVAAVGIPDGSRRGAQLGLSMRLRAAGWNVVAPTDRVVSTFPPNSSVAVAAARRRETAAMLGCLTSAHGPFRSRALSLGDRLNYLSAAVRPLAGLRRAAFVAVVVAALISGRLPFQPTTMGLAALWLPSFVLGGIAVRLATRGTLVAGDRTRWSFATMGPALAGVWGAGRRRHGADLTSPRHGGVRGLADNPVLTATLVLLAIAVPLIAVSDRFTDWLPMMDRQQRAGLLAVLVWMVASILDAMRCLTGEGQLRKATRIETQLHGIVNGHGSTFIDLTPFGAGIIVDRAPELDSKAVVAFEVPSLAHAPAPVTGVARIRSVRPVGNQFVCGVEFVSMDRAFSDALFEYCEVVHSIDRLQPPNPTSQQRPFVEAPVVHRPALAPPRRLGVRFAAATALIGVCITTAPPYNVSFAAPKATGGTISVQVFQDYNANGTRNTAGDATNPAIDALVPGATVTATCLTDNGGDAADGTGDSETYSAPVTAVGDGNGTYTFTNLPGTPCRVEATALPSGFSPGPLGTDNGGLVQFAAAGTTVRMGINRPEEFCQNNPTLVTSCMTFGDAVNGSTSGFGTIKAFSYQANGSLWGGPVPSETPTILATNSSVGSIFGTEYNRSAHRLYLAAYTKVYAGFGPGGPGAVYSVSPSGGATSVLATIPNAGTLPARAAYAPNPNSVSGDWVQDGQYWNSVGTTSLGDMQLSPDESTLWVVNLNDRKLYPVTTATGAVGTPVTIPLATGATTGCASAQVRPFGLGSSKGVIYLGEVCAGPAATDLRMYVYTFDHATATFSGAPVFEASLAYTHGKAGNGCGPNSGSGNWNAWSATNVYNGSTTTNYCSYPQPMLSDIVIDDDGDLILGLRDRFGDQAGEGVPAGPNGGGGEGVSAGDLLRACTNGTGGWVLENDRICGGVTSTATGTSQGPGGREFYADGFATTTGAGSTHQEITVGGLAKVPGFGSVAYTVFDPSTSNGSDWRAGGIRRSSNTTGAVTGFFNLFDKCDSSGLNCPSGQSMTLTFGKVNGLGDLVALCDMAPIEIGNRVWADDNGNGAQDAGEAPVSGVLVTLNVGGTDYTATTDANGVYRFSSDIRFSDTSSANYGITAMTPGATATLTFPNSVAIGGASRGLTRANAPGVGDGIDSDANETAGTAGVTLGGAGANDHTYDAGYSSLYSLGNRVWDDLDNDGMFGAGESGIDGVTVRLYPDNDSNGVADGAAVATQVTSAGGYYLFTSVTTGSYLVEVVTPAGYRSSVGANGASTGPYEGAATPDADVVATDNDDNGSATDASGATVRSKPVTIGAFEPTGEPATPGHADTAADNRSNATVDFGFFRPLSIGNLVWDDVNDSGTVDGAEVGIPGVTVRLLQSGNPIAATTTDADGHYLFTMLGAGDYQVEVVTPAGYRTSTGGGSEPAPDVDTDTGDDDDNGTAAGSPLGTTVVTAAITLAPATEPTADNDARPVGVTDPAADNGGDYTVDFGFWRPVSVGNLVWNDLDDDGIADQGEPGLGGVIVHLFASNGTTEITTGPDGVLGTIDDAPGGMPTASNGSYAFTALPPGAYLVRVELPAGERTSSVADSGDADDDTDNDNNGGVTVVTTATSGQVTLAVGAEPTGDGDTDVNSNLTVDFGIFVPAADMSLVKYTNGCDADTPTGASGPAGGCPPGDGSQNPVVATGATVTWAYVANNEGNVPLTNAQVTDDRVAQASIDCNGGVAGNGQPFTLAVGASLTCTATGIATAGQYDNTATLTADGETVPASVPAPLTPRTEPSHYFAGDPGLAIKKYTVVVDPGASSAGVLTGPAPTVTGTDDADAPGGADPVANHVIADGSTVWWLYRVTNTGNVALDDVDVTDDRGGAVCQNLTVAAGATVWCVLQGSVTRSATTAGQYANVGSVTGVDATTNPGSPVMLGPVSDPSHVFVPAPAISVVKYTNNQDANIPADRPAIPAGQTVTWRYVVTNTGDWPLSAITLTDDREGSIACPPLPGSPARLLPGQSITCTLSGTAVGQPGHVDYVNDAQVIGTPVPPEVGTLTPPTDTDPSGYRPVLAGIGDRVWLDADLDGLQGSAELPVAGVTVRLLDAGGAVVATTATDAAGVYQFTDLDPGSHSVQFVPPTGYVVTVRDVGGDDTLDSDVDAATGRTPTTVLSGGEFDPTWDLGLYQLAGLGDHVWFDVDLDGTLDPGESPVVGAVVELFTDTGVSVATTTTDASGRYRFDGLIPGSYVVQFTAPDGFAFTTHDVGDDAADSDADRDSGQSAVVVLSSGEYDPTIDAGVFQYASLGDRVWADDDHDGVQDPGEPGVPGVTVTLYDATGTPVASDVTDAQGLYWFTGLVPGVYSVGVSNLPSGASITLQDSGDDASDSDADPISGRTVTTTLEAGEADPTWDIGLYGVLSSQPSLPGGATNIAINTDVATGTGTGTGTSLPSTGAGVMQLLVFAAAIGLLGVLVLRVRRPRWSAVSQPG